MLHNKVPPPIIMLFCAIMGGMFEQFSISQQPIIWLLTLGLITISLGIAFVSIRAFRQVKTSINPLLPAKTTVLITDGIFRYSRNPMYLSLLILLLSWACILTSWMALFMCLLFALYITYFQIKPEEKVLTDKFPEMYLQYSMTVRRWL
ncbi:hypothetical protein A9264_14260 [Vibrio sp. UCD-FRSSP16_10]|uniref:methyltransferase family protein n=1 Tax=unclassified Vibrio TaxID=2614977 RepID=UPI000800AA5C|nr:MULTISPECIES: isoprenylcysteine carboxylmethyltransferase family protein [unclassified Vibrio]OBT13268.1 hypothetical protein A9260_14640 [Vibrio sp. UCD-FRSSP16_30]OBT19618.1 hypothetical protein A9264_14260 [Vibrio sp. UCD-FRSSP16_10]